MATSYKLKTKASEILISNAKAKSLQANYNKMLGVINNLGFLPNNRNISPDALPHFMPLHGFFGGLFQGSLLDYSRIRLMSIQQEDRKSVSSYREAFNNKIMQNFINIEKSSFIFLKNIKNFENDINEGISASDSGRVIDISLTPEDEVEEFMRKTNNIKSDLASDYLRTLGDLKALLPGQETTRFSNQVRYYTNVIMFHTYIVDSESFMQKAFTEIDKASSLIGKKETVGDLLALNRVLTLIKILTDNMSKLISEVYGSEGDARDVSTDEEVRLKNLESVKSEGIAGGNWINFNSASNKFEFDHNTSDLDGVFVIKLDDAYSESVKGMSLSPEGLTKKVMQDLLEARLLKIEDGGKTNYGLSADNLKNPIYTVVKQESDTFEIKFKFDNWKNIRKNPSSPTFYDNARNKDDYVAILSFFNSEDAGVGIDGKSDGFTVWASTNSSIKKYSYSVSQPLYSVTDDDGSEILFTPSDLVKNKGKIKNRKGKLIKPKKWKGKGLGVYVQKWKPKGK